MNIIDLHCDALLKLWESRGKASFADSPEIDTNKQRLKTGEVKVQAFAIWMDPAIKTENKFQVALEQIDLFNREVLEKNKEIKQIKEWSDFDKIAENEIGAILTLEGVDPIGNDLTKLNILYQLGVRSIGLTWNQANLAADGAGEARGAGLTSFGKEIVAFNNSHKILTDVSHLCEKAFWDVIETAQFPIASHSNTRKYCDHPRNLSDEQAKALFQKGGMIHVVYCPDFVKKEGRVTIADLIQHIDHLCSLGGVQQIGLGSDFDGISTKIDGLTNAAENQNLINELLKHFKEEEVKGFAYQNFLNHRPK